MAVLNIIDSSEAFKPVYEIFKLCSTEIFIFQLDFNRMGQRIAGKPLKNELKGLRSLKAGRFRIIYRLSSREIIEIVAVGPRRVIYELTYELIRKEREGD